MPENATTVLVELYAEQAKNGASAEKLTETMDRIRRTQKTPDHITISHNLTAAREMTPKLKTSGPSYV